MTLEAPRLLDAGEAALVVEFGASVDPAIHDRVLALDAALQLPVHAALASLTVGRWPLNVPAGAPVVWGENYGYAASEADPAVGEEIKKWLPRTMKKKGLRLRWDRVL